MVQLQPDSNHQDERFEGLNLDGETIHSSSYIDCRFTRCSFVETVLQSCRFQRCVFTGCDLSLVKLPDSVFISVSFDECKLLGVNWTQAQAKQPALGKTLSFKASIINHSTFIGLDMNQLKVVDCLAHQVDFRETDLTGADFGGTDLTDSLFQQTNLSGVDFRTARNYSINLMENIHTGARFTLPEALSLLYGLEIELEEHEADPGDPR